MHKPIQISIPNPCSEDWSKMTPQEQGRFCCHCQKCVVDFTGWTDTQVYNYIAQHKNQKICGRFQTTQLNRTINIPHQPHSLLYKYFIGLGLTLLLTQIPTQNIQAKVPYSCTTPFYTSENNNDNSNDSTTISGQVLDERKEPILGAIIELKNKDTVIAGTMTDEDGNFKITITSGKFENLQLLAMYSSYYTKNIKLNPSNISKHQTIQLELNPKMLQGDIIIQYKVPLIDYSAPNKKVYSSDDIEKMAH